MRAQPVHGAANGAGSGELRGIKGAPDPVCRPGSAPSGEPMAGTAASPELLLITGTSRLGLWP